MVFPQAQDHLNNQSKNSAPHGGFLGHCRQYRIQSPELGQSFPCFASCRTSPLGVIFRCWTRRYGTFHFAQQAIACARGEHLTGEDYASRDSSS